MPGTTQCFRRDLKKKKKMYDYIVVYYGGRASIVFTAAFQYTETRGDIVKRTCFLYDMQL